MDKIFENNLGFHEKFCSRGKSQYLVFSNFLLVLTIFSFWEEDWALDYNSTEFWDFLNSYVVLQLLSQIVFAIFISNNHVPFHLLWKKHLVKYLQVPKQFDHGYRKKLAKITKVKKNKTIAKEKYFWFQTWVCQNVSDEVLLAWFKFQTKIPSFWSIHSVRVTKILFPSPPLSKDKGLRGIGYSISFANLILGVNSVTASYLIHYDSLLQNATSIISKCDSYFITKWDRSLLQNASGFFTGFSSFLHYFWYLILLYS